MTEDNKERVRNLVSEGELSQAIEALAAMTSSRRDKDQVTLLLTDLRSLEKKTLEGIISEPEERLVHNQLAKRVLQFMSPRADHNPPDKSAYFPFNKLLLIPIVVLVLATTWWFGGSLLPPSQRQLTVYVTDVNGNVVLEQEGEIHIPLGNRPLNAQIGEDGRVNFGDILSEYVGQPIKIGLLADGWEIVGNKNEFVFTGEPIHVVVQRDNSLGTIKGSVRSRDGQQFLADAEIRINSDTVIYSDENGFFRVLLPPKMRIDDANRSYVLSVSKEGYKTKDAYYNPKSSEAEIRLEKE